MRGHALLYPLLVVLLGAAADPLGAAATSSAAHGRSLSQARIVNGWNATAGQFPYAGYLLMEKNCLRRAGALKESGPRTVAARTMLCASSLIMPRILLTAGHCMYKCSTSVASDNLPGETPTPLTNAVVWGGPITAKINQVDVSKPTASVPGAEFRAITGAMRHPRYKEVDAIPLEYDIAFLWFDQPSAVTPVQLSPYEKYKVGQEFMIAGWGYTKPPDNGFSVSNTLNVAQVPFVPRDICEQRFGDPVWQWDICAGANPENYMDSCSGDSGGPMVMNKTGVPHGQLLSGLTSYGDSCANDIPGVYTNVAKQRAWLDEQITLNNAGGIEKPKIRCAAHVGHRYKGVAIRRINRVPNAAQCCNACKVTPACRSWAHHKPTLRCSLFGKITGRQLSATWTSGNVTGTLSTSKESPSGRRRALLWRPRLSPLRSSLSAANTPSAPRLPPPPRSTIPTSTSYCEQEFYVQYSDVGGSQLRMLPGVASAGDCCNACQGDPACTHMTYNVKTSECQLFKGPSTTAGWGRRVWRYDYISGLVSRR